MRCERCQKEARRIVRLRGEKKYICTRCRESSQRAGKKRIPPSLQCYL